MKVESVIAAKGPKVVTIHASASIGEASELLSQENIGALVVLDGGPMPIGILSERDIVRGLAHGETVLGHSVSDHMTHNVLCGSPGDDVDAVLETMVQRRFRHLPIADHGELVGIVTIGDLVKAKLREYQGDVDTLQTQLMNA